jgi:uncharacterized protein DUF397
MPDFEYRKSSYSDFDNECVEIATNIPTTVAIRDSKNPTSLCIRITPEAWSAFRIRLLQAEPTGCPVTTALVLRPGHARPDPVHPSQCG